MFALAAVGLWWTGRSELLALVGDQAGEPGLLDALEHANPSRVMLFSAFIASVAAVALAVWSRSLSLQQGLSAWVSGLQRMVPAALILVLSWSFQRVCDADHLNTAGFLAEIGQPRVTLEWLPLVAFVTVGLMTAVLGSTWAALAMALPTYLSVTHALLVDLNEPDAMHPLFLATIGAVIGGTVFGRHCSPISDTTIFASASSSCSHLDHVFTQLPYALCVGGVVVLFGYAPVAYGYSPVTSCPWRRSSLILLLQFGGRPVVTEGTAATAAGRRRPPRRRRTPASRPTARPRVVRPTHVSRPPPALRRAESPGAPRSRRAECAQSADRAARPPFGCNAQFAQEPRATVSRRPRVTAAAGQGGVFGLYNTTHAFDARTRRRDGPRWHNLNGCGGFLRRTSSPSMTPAKFRKPELRRYIDWLIDRGVHGLYPNGSTGEFTRFRADERRRITEIIVDQARGRVPILAGAAEANVKETLAACEHYARLGVRAVAIVAPFYYKLSPAAVYAYFKEIGRNTPVDVTLYNIPMFASPIDVDTVQRLAEECERIVAIKDSSGDIPHMIRMIKSVRPNRPDFAFLTGWDAALMPMLLGRLRRRHERQLGVVPELTRRLYDLTLAGQLDAARKIQYDLITLFDTMIYSAEFPEGFRAAVELRGFRMGSRPPAALARATDRPVDVEQNAAMPAGRARLHERTGRRLPRRKRPERLRPRPSQCHRADSRRRTSPPRADIGGRNKRVFSTPRHKDNKKNNTLNRR